VVELALSESAIELSRETANIKANIQVNIDRTHVKRVKMGEERKEKA
jgi:hypothetical protein